MLPILILCYIRLDTLEATLQEITSQKHGPIYISCDGSAPQKGQKTQDLHAFIMNLKESGVIEDYQILESNFGTLVGVSKGIDWFFKRVDIGIILEDDLILKPTLLDSIEFTAQYLRNRQVHSLGLANRVPRAEISDYESLTRASIFVVSWGWVTTRQNWEARIKSFSEVNFLKLYINMQERIGMSSALWHLYHFYKEYRNEKRNIHKCNWDFMWQADCFTKNQIVISYNHNLVENIGVGEGATHTKGKILDYPIDAILNSEMYQNSNYLEIPNIDPRADKFFCRERKIGPIIRAELRLRTRLNSRMNDLVTRISSYIL